MTEDEMYDIIRGYEESERDYHERNIELENENAKLRDMCSVLYQKYWDVEGDVFIDPDMGKLEKKLRELGIGTWEAWQ